MRRLMRYDLHWREDDPQGSLGMIMTRRSTNQAGDQHRPSNPKAFLPHNRVRDAIGSDITAKPANSFNVSALNTTISLNRETGYDTQNTGRLHIVSRGWHVIAFNIISNSSYSSPLLTIAGMSFLSYESQILWHVNKFVRKLSQNPVNNVVPRFVGEEYLDTKSGQFEWYKATGTTGASWKKITNA